MTSQPTVLCPVDFSDGSRSALRTASSLAESLSGLLVVLTVTDPLLAEAAELASATEHLPEAIRAQLRHFYMEACPTPIAADRLTFEVTSGKPAVEILRGAQDRAAAAIVMGTHGLTGLRKLFFGSTTERVLRETTVPVLLVPATGRMAVRRVLVPVDLSAVTSGLVQAGGRVARAMDVPLLLAHVVEPVRFSVPGLHLPNIDGERRARAEKALTELVALVPGARRAEGLVAYGDPAEEISKLARDRDVGLIVIALHASPLAGPRMGSVTYRVMCTTPTLILAMPVEHLGGVPEVESLLDAFRFPHAG